MIYIIWQVYSINFLLSNNFSLPIFTTIHNSLVMLGCNEKIAEALPDIIFNIYTYTYDKSFVVALLICESILIASFYCKRKITWIQCRSADITSSIISGAYNVFNRLYCVHGKESRLTLLADYLYRG